MPQIPGQNLVVQGTVVNNGHRAQALPVNEGYLQDMPRIQGQNHVVPGTAVNNGHPVSHFVVLLFILVLLLIYMNTL